MQTCAKKSFLLDFNTYYFFQIELHLHECHLRIFGSLYEKALTHVAIFRDIQMI